MCFKIVLIDGCEFIETKHRLIKNFVSTHGSLVKITEVQDEVVLCRGLTTECEAFDGETSKVIFSTNVKHQFACLAIYEGQVTAVAGQETNVVETLSVR